MAKIKPPLTSRLIPHTFPTERDRELYMFALNRIEAGLDLDFYMQRANRGFVLKDGRSIPISYGDKVKTEQHKMEW